MTRRRSEARAGLVSAVLVAFAVAAAFGIVVAALVIAEAAG